MIASGCEPIGSRSVAGLPSLGRRGEGWVVAQVVLLVAVAVAGVLGPDWVDPVGDPLAWIGVFIGVTALFLFVSAMASLGTSLTPLPHPSEGATLSEDGLYAIVRHPIYGAVLAMAIGWSLARSPLALAPTALLAGFFELKSRREEAWLEQRYAGYEAYRRRVRWRFVPGIR
jgi:protein-S-isoprenylcysteine O-methyltransferase Ste14